MHLESLILKPSEKQLPLQVADCLRSAIEQGNIAPGEGLPSSRELATLLGVHRHTITSGLNQLVAEGWLTVTERQGFRVTGAINQKLRESERDSPFPWRFVPDIRLGGFSPSAGNSIDFNFQSGLPDLSHFPCDEFRSYLNESMREATETILDYGSPLGWNPLRDALRNYILEKRNLKADTLVITNGSQEAIYTVARLLLKPGDKVAMEELSYPPARECFRMTGADVLSIPMQDGVMDPDSFEKQARKHAKLKLVFLTPTHQFPSTANMSAAARVAIYAIAAKYKIAILEDDYDHEFHFSSHPPLPLASSDPKGLVIYVSTFSKACFPAARLGFMVVPKVFASQFAQYRRLTVHQNNSLMQDAFARWLTAGGFERHHKKMGRLYCQRRDVMESALRDAKARGRKIAWQTPDGGMAMWVNIQRDSDHFAIAALNRGIFVTPESYYRLNGQAGNHLRLGYSNLEEQAIREGIAKLFST